MTDNNRSYNLYDYIYYIHMFTTVIQSTRTNTKSQLFPYNTQYTFIIQQSFPILQQLYQAQ